MMQEHPYVQISKSECEREIDKNIGWSNNIHDVLRELQPPAAFISRMTILLVSGINIVKNLLASAINIVKNLLASAINIVKIC